MAKSEEKNASKKGKKSEKVSSDKVTKDKSKKTKSSNTASTPTSAALDPTISSLFANSVSRHPCTTFGTTDRTIAGP